MGWTGGNGWVNRLRNWMTARAEVGYRFLYRHLVEYCLRRDSL